MYKTMMATVGAIALLGVSTASAVPIQFTSDGSFSNIQNCSGFPTCSITSGGNQLNMSGASLPSLRPSTINAIDFASGPLNTDLDDVRLGELRWVNRETLLTDQNFAVNYSLVLTFTAPNADTANQTFTLTVQQPTNPPGDVVGGFTIAGLPSTFMLNGVTVSDLKFTEIGDGTFMGSTWRNPEGGHSTLRLTGDFTAVPEPATLTLFGAGLLGLAAVQRRRQQRKAG